MTQSVMINVRVSKDLVKEIDNLEKSFYSNPYLSSRGSITRSEIIRHLIILGIKNINGASTNENDK